MRIVDKSRPTVWRLFYPGWQYSRGVPYNLQTLNNIKIRDVRGSIKTSEAIVAVCHILFMKVLIKLKLTLPNLFHQILILIFSSELFSVQKYSYHHPHKLYYLKHQCAKYFDILFASFDIVTICIGFYTS